jgi:hypothetical protein
MLAYVPKHSVHLRMPLSVFDWLIAKADEAQMPPASYATKRLAELANLDLQREVGGDLLRVGSDGQV